jgi:hypothetical protein
MNRSSWQGLSAFSLLSSTVKVPVPAQGEPPFVVTRRSVSNGRAKVHVFLAPVNGLFGKN